MKLKAYILHNHAAPIQPASHERDWVKENEAVYANLSLNSANAKGWNLLCPCAFEATWNGGASAEDIDIRLDEIQADAPGFVQSQLGGGLLTFHSGYQFKTEGKTALWVRGPINLPRDGLYPLERLVDTSLLPCTVSIQWQFTRANQTIRFEAGEPFCTIVPYPKGYIETEPFESEVVGIADDDEAYEQELQRMIQNPAVQSVFRRLESTGEQAAVPGDIEEGRTEDITYPPVSCICPTYGRVELLEEAIYSFLQQDYPGPKELIVLNDYEPQTLEFDHPEVCIVNLAQRFKSIGEKYEAAVALCSHTLIFVWHDDDIYLPHRLSFSVANFDQTKGFFKANSAWFWNDGQVSGPERNVFHGGSCWTRDLFAQVQGYPHLNTGYDIGFEQLCEEARPGSIRVHPARPEEVYYVYRWSGTDSYHLSALSQNGQADQEVLAFVQKRAQWGLIKQGQIALKPHWRTDYSLLVHNVLNHGPVEQTEREEKAVPYPPPFYVIPSPPPLADEAAANLFEETYPARISVILPASNESVLLKRTVEQFEATLPANSEVLVVDNGSTDGSADFLVNQERPGVTLIQTGEPLGVVGARNRGLAQAQGEVVVFADAHIDIPCHWWQPIVAALNQPNVGVVGPGIGVMGEPMLPVAYGQRIIADPVLRVEWLSKQSEEPYPVPTLGGGFMAMRHDILKQAGAFDAGMPQWGSEDLELCLRYWLLGYEVWTVPAVTILHYFRQANPYKIEGNAVIHNLLRAALLHFNQERIARVVAALKADANFDQALAYAVDSDVWQQRVALAGRRVWDDDWLFEKFKDSSSV